MLAIRLMTMDKLVDPIKKILETSDNIIHRFLYLK